MFPWDDQFETPQLAWFDLLSRLQDVVNSYNKTIDLLIEADLGKR